MPSRAFIILGSVVLVLAAAWTGMTGVQEKPAESDWEEVAPGILRTARIPRGYALVDGKSALLIDAPQAARTLKAAGIERVELVLLTHGHRDTAAAVGSFLDAEVPVRAPKSSSPWLQAEAVRQYWRGAIPLRNSREAVYQIFPEGFDGIDCSLAGGDRIDWRGWSLRVLATPGHTRDHVAYAARKGKDDPPVVFCGDAFASPGKIWTPYCTDWDHWTDLGLKPAAESLRKLAELKPARLLPAHGRLLDRDCAAALKQTADTVAEVAFLRSYERFTKERLGNAPDYKFLAPEQRQSIGELPWSRISKHLFLTGNTYVLVSDTDKAFLILDPFGRTIAQQVTKFVKDEHLGTMERILFSHAHYDHYAGVHDLPGRDKARVWTLDMVAEAMADPFRLRAPFLDPRPVAIDRLLKDGETAEWREYKFKFHHYPGQTHYTMAVETAIDGKRCLFTADNFFHQDMFSGSGGWMGVNWSWPLPYAASAKKTLDIAPEWVLAEHGGPFEFTAEDWRRRVRWGEAGAKAADAISPSGHHRLDWDPNRVHARPLLQAARPGAAVTARLVASNPLPRKQRLTIVLRGRGKTDDQKWTLDVPAGGRADLDVKLVLSDKLQPGRLVFPLDVYDGDGQDPCDALLVIDVTK